MFSYLSSLLGIYVGKHKSLERYKHYPDKNDHLYTFAITVFPNILWGFFNTVVHNYIFDILCRVLKIKPGTETSDTFAD